MKRQIVTWSDPTRNPTPLMATTVLVRYGGRSVCRRPLGRTMLPLSTIATRQRAAAVPMRFPPCRTPQWSS